MRTCSRCRLEFPVHDFYPGSYKCKACCSAFAKERRKKNPELFRQYGKTARENAGPAKRAAWRRAATLRAGKLTQAEFRRRVEAQTSQCAICGDEARLVSDHDHATGTPRELLCMHCNLLWGHAQDDVSRLEAAIRDLIKHGKSRAEAA